MGNPICHFISSASSAAAVGGERDREMARALGRAFVRGGKPYSFRLLSPASSAHLCTEGDGFQSSRVKIFDRDLKRKQVESLRDRAAWLMRGKDEFVDSVAENLLDRLQVNLAVPFSLFLNLMMHSIP
ncbi:hypothetical protein BHM03_00010316 [Ensete ventricosum]|nr:hypothetical protein BHM03_00010316 [Ensete ventricosum]